MATKRTAELVQEFLSRPSYSEKTWAAFVPPFYLGGTVSAATSAHLLSVRRRRSQNDLLTAGFLPLASAGVGGSQKGNLRPSVSVHEELFNAPYKVADQHISSAALLLVR